MRKKVFTKASATPITEQVLYHQLLLLGRIGRSDPGDPLRRDVLFGDAIRPQVGRYVRRVGRYLCLSSIIFRKRNASAQC